MVLTANAAFTERHRLEYITIPSPIAGANVAYTVPDNTVIQIVGVSLLFVTDANAADRRVVVNNTVQMQSSASPLLQTANLAWAYRFTCGVGFVDGTGDGSPTVYCPLACGLQLCSGQTVDVRVVDIQAGDQLNSVYLQVYRWKED